MDKLKELIKSYIKPCVRILCFLCIFMCIVALLSTTVFSRAQASEYNNKYSETMSFYNEPDNTLQIVAIGNSNLYSGFCPHTLWYEKGFTSTAIGAPRQTPQESFNLLKEALNNQSPDLVIIECDMLYDESPGETKISGEKSKLDIVFDYLKPESFEEGVKNVFPLFTFHDRWKNEKNAGKSNTNHGYKFSDIVNPINVDYGYMKQTDQIEDTDRSYISDMSAMISYCKERKISVLLINLPSPASWDYKRHNLAAKIAKENNVPYIDFNLMLDEIGVDMSTDFRDAGNHLNYNGSQKTSHYLADYIFKNYSLEDKRQDEKYEFWQKTYDEFMTLV